MGNKVIIDDSYGKIEIQLQKFTFIAGEQINGWVQVSLVKPFPNDTLYLTISGTEKTQFVFEQRVNTGRGVIVTHDKHKGKNTFYEHLIPLYKHESGSFPAGQYSFPFSFKLDEDLIGSFALDYFNFGYACFGKVVYKIKAGFKDQASKKTFFKKTKFYVNALQKSPPSEQISDYDKQLRGYCYINIGTYRIHVHLDKDKFVSGDTCSMTIEVDNTDAKRNAKNLKCQLYQVTTLKNTKCSKTDYVNHLLSDETLAGIPKGESRKGPDAFKVQLPIKTNNELQASCHGKLVTNQFVLVFTTELDACLCCRNHPHKEIEIMIYNKMVILEPRNPHDNWNPQVISHKVLPLGADTKLTPAMKSQIYE